MNALRQIVNSNDGSIKINLPKEYQKQPLEIIILPISENENPTKSPNSLVSAHKIIDEGCSNIPENFIEDYEKHLSDRELPRE